MNRPSHIYSPYLSYAKYLRSFGQKLTEFEQLLFGHLYLIEICNLARIAVFTDFVSHIEIGSIIVGPKTYICFVK